MQGDPSILEVLCVLRRPRGRTGTRSHDNAIIKPFAIEPMVLYKGDFKQQ